jgi:ribosomal protein S12 methylthiotransferase accessory factor
MNYDIECSFPGGEKVDAHYNGFTVHTDQEVRDGGEGSAPQPFDLFFVSLATCAGYYALRFCSSRNIKSDGLGVRLTSQKNEGEKLFDKIKICLTLPGDFPAKYRNAIVRAVDLCTVMRHIRTGMQFFIEVT